MPCMHSCIPGLLADSYILNAGWLVVVIAFFSNSLLTRKRSCMKRLRTTHMMKGKKMNELVKERDRDRGCLRLWWCWL